MTFLLVLEILAAWFLVAVVLSVLLCAIAINFHREPRLLDGRKLQSVLDDRDRRHLVVAHTAHVQPLLAFADELDEIHNLPEREPWERWH
jgi:hypothetical protein